MGAGNEFIISRVKFDMNDNATYDGGMKNTHRDERKLMWALFGVCCAVIMVASCTAAKSSQTSGDGYWPTDTWRSSKPEKQGLNSKTLNTIDEYVKRDFPTTTSVLIVRNGSIVFERYYEPAKADELRPQFSITKSMISALTGIAIGKGLIGGTGSEIYEYLPDSIRSGMEADARKITIHHLLTMTSGLADTRGLGDIEPSSLRTWLSVGHTMPAGKVFAYNGDNPNLLSVIITKASGLRASEFAQKYLFDPIGIKDVKWDEGSEYTQGFSGTRLTTRDMARFGYLYLRKGRWNNVQVIPEEWIARSTKEQTPIPAKYRTPGINDAYGYLWWTMWYGTRFAYSAIGFGGQRICVLPDLDFVIVFTTSGTGENEQLPIIMECILGSLKP
jgi:CubicO group peptidase (beta-lactamase class C family)